METVLEMLHDLSGAIGGNVQRELTNSDLVRRFGTAAWAYAMCIGFQRRPWQTSCQNVDGTEPLERESKMTQGHQLRKCCLHMTPKPSSPAKRGID